MASENWPGVAARCSTSEGGATPRSSTAVSPRRRIMVIRLRRPIMAGNWPKSPPPRRTLRSESCRWFPAPHVMAKRFGMLNPMLSTIISSLPGRIWIFRRNGMPFSPVPSISAPIGRAYPKANIRASKFEASASKRPGRNSTISVVIPVTAPARRCCAAMSTAGRYGLSRSAP